jgi:hypothetical protein
LEGTQGPVQNEAQLICSAYAEHIYPKENNMAIQELAAVGNFEKGDLSTFFFSRNHCVFVAETKSLPVLFASFVFVQLELYGLHCSSCF